MASNVQQFLHHSLIFSLTLLVTWLNLANAATVYLKYNIPKVEGDSMPDELNVTVYGESGDPIYLHLRYAQNVAPNLPVYTIGVNETGGYIHHLEQLEDKKNIGFYQDVSSEAIIQVTRIDGRGDNETRFELVGELNIEGQIFILNPEGRLKRGLSQSLSSLSLSDDAAYTLIPHKRSPGAVYDYSEAPSQAQLKAIRSSSSSKASRWNRQSGTVQPIFIDVIAIADYFTYRRFLASSSSKTETLQAMREYYSFIFSGVDMLYQGIINPQNPINVRLVKLIIAETAYMSEFTEKFRKSSSPRDVIDADKSLEAFRHFIAGSGRDVFSPYDHAMLFTRYDLTSITNGIVSKDVLGLAYVGTLCLTEGWSTSIIEDGMDLHEIISTATHELAHSFSAHHDGKKNNCNPEDVYIMQPGNFGATSSNKLNPWLFSSCSINYFNSYIYSQLETEDGAKCLLEKLPISGVPDVTNRLPGRFTADDQCRSILGNLSYVNRLSELSSPSDICTEMYCSVNGATSFQRYTAATGTTCGNGKLCLRGECVSDPRAPIVNDDCVFGDQPGIVYESQTCPEFIRNFSNYCGTQYGRDICCESCRRVNRNVHSPGRNSVW